MSKQSSIGWMTRRAMQAQEAKAAAEGAARRARIEELKQRKAA